MSQKAEQEELITGYLLGRLSEEERASVEQKFLDDNEFFEQLLAIESALTDEYVQGNLSGDDKRQFERLMNSSRPQQQDVEFTRELRQAVSSAASEKKGADYQKPGRRFFRIGRAGAPARYAAWASLCLLIAFGAGMLTWSLRQQEQLTQLRGELDKANAREVEMARQLDEMRRLNEKLTANLNPPGDEQKNASQSAADSRPPRETIATITLTPFSINRGSKAAPIVRAPAAAQTLRFRLVLTAKTRFDSYAVEVKTFEGNVVWHHGGLRPARDRVLVFDVSANALADSDYIISLKGAAAGGAYEDVQDYPFTLRR